MSELPPNGTRAPQFVPGGLDDQRAKWLADLLVEVARYVDADVADGLPAHPVRGGGDTQLEALRSVLLEDDRSVLDRLREKFDDPQQFADAVSAVLADAFGSAGARDEQLAKVMAPTLERATQASIRKDPSTLVGILYPLMGPAIRKSISETLEVTLQNLNQAFKHSFSLRGLKWRLEALRSGSSFGDVVLKHTVEFRVEHVFLIHRKTGLLLEHVAAPQVAGQDPQLVSGMLTAIQDFVHDSFESGTGRSSAGIDSLRLGDLMLWSEEGPFAFLAVVIRGNPPESLRAVLRDTLTRIHEDLRIPLDEFDGDTGRLGDLATTLEGCLQHREQPPETRISPWLWALPLALLLLLGSWMALRAVEAGHVNDYVQRLQEEPGVIVTSAERAGGRWQITGLRDPLAVDPTNFLADSHLSSDRVVGHWEAYQALDPAMTLQRLRASLDPPPGVGFTLDGDVIRAEGSAPDHWVDRARALIAALPAGAPTVDLSAVSDVQDPTYVRLRDAIQAQVIHFEPNAARPAVDQEPALDAVAAELSELIGVARDLGFSVRVMIVGHADATGYQTSNLSLTVARAEVVRSMLRERGIAPDLLAVRGAGTLEPLLAGAAPEDEAMNRSVTFTVATAD